MRSYASHLLQHIGGNASQARLKCIAKCDAIPDKLCPAECFSPGPSLLAAGRRAQGQADYSCGRLLDKRPSQPCTGGSIKFTSSFSLRLDKFF